MTPLRALGFALFLSLAGNLFFAGQHIARERAAQDAAATEKEDCAPRDWKKGRHHKLGFLKELPESDRALLKEGMEAHGEKIAALREKMKAQRESFRDVMGSDDPAALEKALAESARTRAEFMRLMRDIRQKAEAGFSPEGRAVIEKAQEEMHDRFRRHREERSRGREGRDAELEIYGPLYHGPSMRGFHGGEPPGEKEPE